MGNNIVAEKYPPIYRKNIFENGRGNAWGKWGKKQRGGVKIIEWGKTPCKSYPTLLVSIVCIDRATRRVS